MRAAQSPRRARDLRVDIPENVLPTFSWDTSPRSRCAARVPAGRVVFFSVLATLAIGAAGQDQECYCDGWYSTNTRTLDFPDAQSETSAGMSYRGTKRTTVNGMACMAWKDVFATCTAGFEAANEDAILGNPITSKQWVVSSYLAHMTPDRMGKRGDVHPTGLFDDYDAGFNQCRMPSLREAWEHSKPANFHPDGRYGGGVGFVPAGLTASGPFCFVDATDPRAAEYTSANGWSWGETNLGFLCPQVAPVPCGVNRCAPDTSANAETACARSSSPGSSDSASSAQLLMANGGMDLWERRSNVNGVMRNANVANLVSYREHPPYPQGSNPEEPRFWDLCLYTPENVQKMGLGFNATTDGADDMLALLHKTGALVLCDPVHPRAEGISLSQVSPGRGGVTESSAARVAFVKVNDTASLKAENGAMASMVPDATHVARAWVRCAKGSSTVALVVSKLPKEAPVVSQDIQVSMFHYDAMTNVSVGGESTTNTVRCDVDPAAYTSSSDASESASGWVELEVAVSSTEAEHDITVQLIVQSHSNDAAVLMDDVSWELATSASPRMTMLSDSSSAASVFATTCAGGGGGGVSYTDAHKCSTDPTRLFYRLREMGGVPVAYEQVHAMVVIGYKSVRCRRPTLDALSQAECPFLSEASLPHLSADDVRAFMDTLTDAELEAAMRWGDVSSRGPGVRTSLAIEILRAGLPDAIEKGIVRAVDGPKYNNGLFSYDNPNIGSSPASAIAWHSLQSTSGNTTDLKVFYQNSWKECAHHEGLRHALCYFWGDLEFTLGCGMVKSLIANTDGWEHYVLFEGWLNTLEVVNNHYTAFLEPIVKHFVDINLGGEAVCYQSIMHLQEELAKPDPNSGIAAAHSTVSKCAAPLLRAETLALLSLVLPLAPPEGMTCVDLTSVDYMTIEPFGHHEHLDLDDDGDAGGAGDVWNRYGTWIAVGVGVLAMCGAFAWLTQRRQRRRAEKNGNGPHLTFSHLDAISSNVLSNCERSNTILGKGADSEVYFAQVTLAGGVTKTIATKMFFRSHTAKAEINFYERMPRHDHILTVLGCYFDKEMQRWCVAMEYCRHGNVRVCMQTKQFPRHGLFMHRTLSGMMGALSTLHANGMAHRDLKLDNVLLSCECEAGAECVCLRTYAPGVRAKLSDFAMSRDGKLMGVSSANMKGTVMYVAPERVEYDAGKHEADFYFRGDVYALGLMTWEMLHYLHSGEVVSCAEAILPGVRSPQDVLIRIAAGTFVPPCEFLPDHIVRYLKKCWHFDPQKRFKDAGDALRVWQKLHGLVHAVGDKSALMRASIASSSKDSETYLLGTTGTDDTHFTGVTTATASPPISNN